MNKKIGIIDCGTNTFHLMIVTVKDNIPTINYRIKKAVRIGAGGINKNIILPDAEARAISTLKDFKKIAKTKGAKKIYAFATSAFRNATNGEVLKIKIQKETGVEISIIDGNREAELIFKGVNYALKLGVDPSLVMDIGGGSVEFIIGDNSGIKWKRSFEIGGQRLVEKFHKSDPILPIEIKALELFLAKELEELFIALNKYTPTVLAGSSGTFDTLSEMYTAESVIDLSAEQAELPLTFEAYAVQHQQLISLSRAERLQIPGMIEMRVDMIVVASCLINYILSRYTFSEIRVSTYSLKEGFLTEMITQ